MNSGRQTAIEASSISGQAIGSAFTRGVLPLGRTPADNFCTSESTREPSSTTKTPTTRHVPANSVLNIYPAMATETGQDTRWLPLPHCYRSSWKSSIVRSVGIQPASRSALPFSRRGSGGFGVVITPDDWTRYGFRPVRIPSLFTEVGLMAQGRSAGVRIATVDVDDAG